MLLNKCTEGDLFCVEAGHAGDQRLILWRAWLASVPPVADLLRGVAGQLGQLVIASAYLFGLVDKQVQ